MFTAVPLAELALLIKLGTYIGTGETILLVLVTGALGAWLAREQGMRVIGEFNDAARRGETPADQLIDGFLVTIGGALLITPGVMTDFVGLALVAPWSRRAVREYLKKRLNAQVNVVSFRSGPAGFYYTHRSGQGDRPPAGRDDDDDIIDV
ncbi:MAG: FxsA family protein [Candidatus Nitrospinota bacterium M3_3B_026]